MQAQQTQPNPVRSKIQTVKFEKNGIMHVRVVPPGEDQQAILSRPTEVELKHKRIADEDAILAKIPNSADVLAFAHTLKRELKAKGLRFPLEVYEYTKKRMEGEAQPFKHAIRAVRDEGLDLRPDPEDLKPLNVCPRGCGFKGKRVDIHMKHCKYVKMESTEVA